MILEEFDKIHKASIILIVSLFLCMIWYVIPSDWTWTFPYYDNFTGSFSRHPSEPKTYYVQDMIYYVVSSFRPVLYIWAFTLVGNNMKMPIIGNIWYYYALTDVLLTLNLILAFNTTPIGIGLFGGVSAIQLWYRYYSSLCCFAKLLYFTVICNKYFYLLFSM